MPLVIGVTGSIATGKSGLCARLVGRWGAIHGDADKIVHRMFDPGKPGRTRGRSGRRRAPEACPPEADAVVEDGRGEGDAAGVGDGVPPLSVGDADGAQRRQSRRETL